MQAAAFSVGRADTSPMLRIGEGAPAAGFAQPLLHLSRRGRCGLDGRRGFGLARHMSTRVACFAMSAPSHFRPTLAVAKELVRAGATVRFWTDRQFCAEVEAAGAEFADLFSPVPLAEIDDTSIPVPSRWVTFAAAQGERVAAEALAWGAAVVVYDSFALVGEVVGRRLDLPWVPVFSMHLIDAATMRSRTAAEPRVRTDPRCLDAVDALGREFGIADASPFRYFADPSPWLNVMCEPEEWLDPPDRQRYQPLACFGNLPSSALAAAPVAHDAVTPPRLYAAFGTVVWWYWPKQAAAAFEVIAEAAQEIGAHLVIGLGGGAVPDGTKERLLARGAIVHDFADQPAELQSADIFITHHGASSAHEAIAAMVPMLSFPFSSDQPAIAKRCQEIGVALPLIEGWGRDEVLTLPGLRQKINEALSLRPQMLDALHRARSWEVSTLAGRPEVARRIVGLAEARHP